MAKARSKPNKKAPASGAITTSNEDPQPLSATAASSPSPGPAISSAPLDQLQQSLKNVLESRTHPVPLEERIAQEKEREMAAKNKDKSKGKEKPSASTASTASTAAGAAPTPPAQSSPDVPPVDPVAEAEARAIAEKNERAAASTISEGVNVMEARVKEAEDAAAEEAAKKPDQVFVDFDEEAGKEISIDGVSYYVKPGEQEIKPQVSTHTALQVADHIVNTFPRSAKKRVVYAKAGAARRIAEAQKR